MIKIKWIERFLFNLEMVSVDSIETTVNGCVSVGFCNRWDNEWYEILKSVLNDIFRISSGSSFLLLLCSVAIFCFSAYPSLYACKLDSLTIQIPQCPIYKYIYILDRSNSPQNLVKLIPTFFYRPCILMDRCEYQCFVIAACARVCLSIRPIIWP